MRDNSCACRSSPSRTSTGTTTSSRTTSPSARPPTPRRRSPRSRPAPTGPLRLHRGPLDRRGGRRDVPRRGARDLVQLLAQPRDPKLNPAEQRQRLLDAARPAPDPFARLHRRQEKAPATTREPLEPEADPPVHPRPQPRSRRLAKGPAHDRRRGVALLLAADRDQDHERGPATGTTAS